MELAKPGLDVGMFTERLDAHIAFWRDAAGLPSEQMLKLGGGIHQHRFVAGTSVIKVNNSLHALPGQGSGIAGISLLRPGLSGPIVLHDPDGQQAKLLPSTGRDDMELVVHMHVSDLDAHHDFWRSVMQLPAYGDGYACGTSAVQLYATDAPRHPESWKVRGWSYLTVQVRDCVSEHAAALRRGAREGVPPRRMGDAAVISFIRDPDGNFIELSQKAELVGPLGLPLSSTRPTNPETSS